MKLRALGSDGKGALVITFGSGLASEAELHRAVADIGIPVHRPVPKGAPPVGHPAPYGITGGDSSQPKVEVTYRLVPLKRATFQLVRRSEGKLVARGPRQVFDDEMDHLLIAFGPVLEVTPQIPKAGDPQQPLPAAAPRVSARQRLASLGQGS